MTSSSPDDSADGYTSDFSSSSWAWTSALWNVHCFLRKVVKASCGDGNETVLSSSKSPSEYSVSVEKDPLQS